MKTKTNTVCYFLVVLLCFFTLSSDSAEASATINWRTYNEGIALGKTEKKKVFLHFYANWCFYCRKMAKETFSDPSVIEFLNKKFISIRVDSDKDRRTASEYNVRALPSTWLLTEKGKRIGNIPGFITSKQLLDLLKQIDTRHDKAMGQGG